MIALGGRHVGERVGEALVDGDVGVPLLGVERRAADGVVVQRPQRVVGEALVVVVDLLPSRCGPGAGSTPSRVNGSVSSSATPVQPTHVPPVARSIGSSARTRPPGLGAQPDSVRITGRRLAATTTIGRVRGSPVAHRRRRSQVDGLARQSASRACSRSATRSAVDSMPTDSRIRSSRHLERRAGDRGVGHLARDARSGSPPRRATRRA